MNIREMRTQLGDTQSEFAARYNIPFRTIQNWEAEVRKPPEYDSVGGPYTGRPCQSKDKRASEVRSPKSRSAQKERLRGSDRMAESNP